MNVVFTENKLNLIDTFKSFISVYKNRFNPNAL